MANVANYKKIFIVGLVCTAALGYLFVSGMRSSMVYYLTLEELYGSKTPQMGEGVRLVGSVKAGSIEGSTVDGGIRFVMTDGERELAVHYAGQVPDAMEDDVEVVVEGVYRGQPVFEAASLLAKCPSKYEAEAGEAGQSRADGKGKIL